MKVALITIGCVIGLILIMGGCVIGIRNDLVTKEESTKNQWSEIDNQLQRRYDLIPNLVNSVKGYAKHEEAVFKNIADARAAMGGAKGPSQVAKAQGELESALSRLMVIVENYPTLKADQNFMRLQDELAGTENRIAVARKRYNESVNTFNSSIRRFPGMLFGFDKLEYFNPPAGEKVNVAPKVEF